ncbi:MAG: ABC transporter ATP-binding protein [Thermoplasmata archaeon]|nr:ABC transporter ATP-binding protein [Thermoplasmata archaeon]
MHAVEVRDLIKNYGSFKAVKGISFDVNEGEIFGLIGPNGAGKTTTLRVLSTLIQLTGGSVKIFGIDLVKDSQKIREIISYLPEDAGAYKQMTGKEYLKFIAQFFKRGDGQDATISRGIKIANLKDRIDDKVDTYSKGMARKLLVSRALMIDPKLAILDEPTAGLDVLNSQEIRKIIKETARKGTSVLLSSHNMLEVELMCDRIALISDGKILETGSPSELKTKYDSINIEEVFVKVVG